MNRVLLSAAAASALLLTIPAAANAAQWQSINQRQASLDRRIDQGVRSGELTRREATSVRGEFRTLARLEDQYRRSNGLSARERADLDARFDRLSQRIRNQKHDRQDRPGSGR